MTFASITRAVSSIGILFCSMGLMVLGFFWMSASPMFDELANHRLPDEAPWTRVSYPIVESAEPLGDDEADSPDAIDRLKAASVYIKVVGSKGSQTGSGFLLEKVGNKGTVVTNAHVVRVAQGSLEYIECVFNSGTRQEYSVRSTVIGSDDTDDIAVLSVERNELPEPLDTTSEVPLRETLPVLILGFPFGEGLTTSKRSPAITVSKAIISSIRRDDDDQVAVLQLDGGINSGNSGGPVVTSDGKLVGVSVAKVVGTDIGFAVPRWKLSEALLGRLTGFTLSQARKGTDKDGYQVSVSVIDPRNNITSASMLTCPSKLVENAKPLEGGKWEQATETMKEIALERQGLKFEGHAPYESNEGGTSFQIRLIRNDGSKHFTRPVKLDLSRLNAPTKKPSAGTENQEGLTRVAPIEVAATHLLPFLVWSRDEMHCITLSRGGLIQKFSLTTFKEVQREELKARCSFLGRSKDGLVVVLDEVQQVCSVDEDTLEVKRKVKVPGVSRVACAPASTSVYHYSEKVFSAIDLRNGKSKPMTVEVKPVRNLDPGEVVTPQFLTCTPDGKFLVCKGVGDQIQRLRIAGNKLMLEESGPRIGANVQDVIVSPDSKFVAMPSGAGNLKVEGHPSLNFGTYVYAIGNLQKAHLGMSTGRFPKTIGFDSVGKKIYAQNMDAQLLVFTMEGARESAFLLPGRSMTRMLVAHPQGNRVCVMTQDLLFWVELAGAPDELIDRKEKGKGNTEVVASKTAPEKSKPEPRKESVRTWQDKSGKFKIVARLIEVDGEMVVLEKEDGTQSRVPLAKLSEADQTFAKRE